MPFSPVPAFRYRVYGKDISGSVIEHPMLPMVGGAEAQSDSDRFTHVRFRPDPLSAPHVVSRRLTWLVLALFAAVEIWLIISAHNGPFTDEAIYATAGIRTLYGFGMNDGYLTWFAGSLLWPVFSALGYTAGGLAGSRLVALICVLIAGTGSVQGARNLFGDRAALWCALALVCNGPFLALAHLAVYDVLALAGVGVSFWGITALSRHNHRGWLLVAAIAFGVTILAEYPIVLCGIPLACLLFALRGKRAWLDLGMFGFIFLALLLAYFLPLRTPLTQFFLWRVQNNSSFGVTPAMLRFSLLYYAGVPIVLAIPGVLLAPGQRWVALSLVGALFLWPVYHEVTANSVSSTKHIVFGFLFGYPLIGLVLANLWSRRNRLWHFTWVRRGSVVVVLAALVFFGATQMAQLDRGWADTRPATNYLVHHMQPGQDVLSSDSWPYQLALYTNARIASPWDVYDAYDVEHSAHPLDLCRFNWFVDEQNGTAWPTSLRQSVMDCGTFHLVYQTSSTVTNISRNLTFVSYPVTISIWSNALPT